MKKYLNVLKLLTVFLLVTSCVTPFTVIKSFQYDKENKIEKIALFPVMIGKLNKPILPLIDAAIFNKKPNQIAPNIMKLEKTKVNDIEFDTAKILAKYFKCNVVYGDSLKILSQSVDLKRFHSSRGLTTNDPNFSSIILAESSINPFSFEEGNVAHYFKAPSNYSSIIRQLCEVLKVDAIAVSHSYLSFGNVQIFGISARLNLNTHIYLFDKNGNLLTEGVASSKGFQSKGKDISEYGLVLDDYPTIFDPLVQRLLKKK